MTHPQSTAQKLAKNFPELPHIQNIAKYGCAAFTAMWSFGVNTTDIEAIRTVSDAIDAGVLDDECTVFWNDFAKWLIKRTVKVEKRNIKDILSIRNRTPVFYAYKGVQHCVGVQNGKIAFNSLKYSNCVENGQPVSARILTIGGQA